MCVDDCECKEVAAGVVIFRLLDDKNVEFLLMQASYPPYHWTPPKGHIENGETLHQAAFREVTEETSLKNDVDYTIYDDFKVTLRYMANGNPKKCVYFLGKLKSKANITLSNEHQHYEWVSLEKALTLIQYKNTQNLLEEAYECVLFKLSNDLI